MVTVEASTAGAPLPVVSSAERWTTRSSTAGIPRAVIACPRLAHQRLCAFAITEQLGNRLSWPVRAWSKPTAASTSLSVSARL